MSIHFLSCTYEPRRRVETRSATRAHTRYRNRMNAFACKYLLFIYIYIYVNIFFKRRYSEFYFFVLLQRLFHRMESLRMEGATILLPPGIEMRYIYIPKHVIL